MTNATKGVIVALVNAALGVAISFGVGLNDVRQAAITTFVNAGLSAWILLTYKNSPTRIPDAPYPLPPPPPPPPPPPAPPTTPAP
jgi:hypothetical protein